MAKNIFGQEFHCPKCGGRLQRVGADMENRLYCGFCYLSEFKKDTESGRNFVIDEKGDIKYYYSILIYPVENGQLQIDAAYIYDPPPSNVDKRTKINFAGQPQPPITSEPASDAELQGKQSATVATFSSNSIATYTSGSAWGDIVLGRKNGREVKLSSTDRPLGVVLLGQTGFGKTSLLENLAAADIGNCTSIIFDPHGELSERMLRIGAAIAPDKLLFCEIGNNLSYGFNPLEVQNPGDPLEESQTIDSLMQVFRKHWSDNPGYTFGPRVEWVLSNTARTILANPGYTLAEIPLLLHDKAFRDKLVRNVTNPQVQFFWGEYRQLESTRRPIDVWQMVESTVTRLTQFLANEWLYRVLYQAKGTIKFHELIESRKTIIFSLPIGKLGEEPASLLGSLLLGKLATTIFGRNEYGKTYPRVHIYIDEYARFSVPIISQLWVQARKFNCGITATVQTLSQIKNDEDRAAILQAEILLPFNVSAVTLKLSPHKCPYPIRWDS